MENQNNQQVRGGLLEKVFMMKLLPVKTYLEHGMLLN